MAVEVRLPTVLRSHAGGRQPSSASTAPPSARCSPSSWPSIPGMAGQVLTDDGTLHKFVNVYVERRRRPLSAGLDTPVADGAEVSILPAVAGG